MTVFFRLLQLALAGVADCHVPDRIRPFHSSAEKRTATLRHTAANADPDH